jgi:hypothetical protein
MTRRLSIRDVEEVEREEGGFPAALLRALAAVAGKDEEVSTSEYACLVEAANAMAEGAPDPSLPTAVAMRALSEPEGLDKAPRSPITCRRAADDAVSRMYGGRGCGTHTPSSIRPGPISAQLRDGFAAAGYPLATTRPLIPVASSGLPPRLQRRRRFRGPTKCRIEVYIGCMSCYSSGHDQELPAQRAEGTFPGRQ